MTYARYVIATISIVLMSFFSACGGGGGDNNPAGGSWDSMTWDQNNWS